MVEIKKLLYNDTNQRAQLEMPVPVGQMLTGT
jgi:hypothetical protein